MRFFIKFMLLPLVFNGCGKVERTPGAPAEGDTTSDDSQSENASPNGSIEPEKPAVRVPGNEPKVTDSKVVEKKVNLTSDKFVIVRGSLFRGREKPGDFGWMIDQRKYAKTLFVFNDNEQQFEAFMRGDKSESGCGSGGNNGVVRPYQCKNPPRAAGVPTGSNGAGYASLTPQVKARIDRAIAHIRKVATEGDFDTVVFSQSNKDGHPTLAANIFAPGMDVRDYIFESLLRLNPGE